MSKPLFDDVGRELKEIAEATARRITVAYALLGIALLAGGFFLFAETDEGFCIAVGVVAAVWAFLHGYNKAHMEVIQLYAYGELVHRVTSIENTLAGQRATAKKAEPQLTGKDGTPLVKKRKNGSWQCPYCDHHNPPGADWCEECGIQASYE